MNARRPDRARTLATLGLAAGLALGLAGRAGAQHTPDPYNIVGEYNRQYEPYMYANVPNTEGMTPNQGRLDGRTGLRGANRFQNYLDDAGDDGEGVTGGRSLPSRLSGPGVPYYRANRTFDKEFQRQYRPNDQADRSFYSNQQQRNDKYFQALHETDPRKRAQLLREYNLDNLRSARSLTPNRNANERDRERELERDRLTPGGLPRSTPGGGNGEPAARTPPAPGRRTAVGPPPAPRGRFATPVRPIPGTPAPRAGVAPSRPSADSREPTGVLERSELLDRATQGTAPRAPAPRAPRPTTAPPPPG